MSTWTYALTQTRRLIAVAGCLMVTATLATPVAASPAAVDELAAGERYLRTYLEQTKAPGLAYAVIRGDEVLQARRLGHRR